MRYYVRKDDTTRLLLAISATLHYHQPARPWQSPAMEAWYTPDYFEYDTPIGMVKLVRYDVDTPKPIAPSGVPAGANVVIGVTPQAEALLASIPYLWTATTAPKQVKKAVPTTQTMQASFFGDDV